MHLLDLGLGRRRVDDRIERRRGGDSTLGGTLNPDAKGNTPLTFQANRYTYFLTSLTAEAVTPRALLIRRAQNVSHCSTGSGLL